VNFIKGKITKHPELKNYMIIKKGGYYDKYLKYKNKYINLKNTK